MREGGQTAKAVLALWKQFDAELARSASADVQALRKTFAAGVQAASECVDFFVGEKNPRATFAGAVPFLKLMGIVAGGWQMARAALAAEKHLARADADKAFYEAKIATARFYADHVLVQAPGLRNTVVNGAAGVMALSEDQFLAA
jgi:butyryl-CoA dehydrogenase